MCVGVTTVCDLFAEVEGTEPLQNGQPGEEDDVVGTPPPQDYSSLEPAAAIEVIAEERSAAPPTTAEPREVEEVGQKQPKSWASCVSKNTGSTGTKPPSSSSSTSVSTSTKPVRCGSVCVCVCCPCERSEVISLLKEGRQY